MDSNQELKSVLEVANGKVGGFIHIGNVMELYKSHKVVKAAEIVAVIGVCAAGADLRIANPTNHEMEIPYFATPDMLARFTPQVGDYIVLYADDYVSFSPKSAFEDGYSIITEPVQCDDYLMEQDIQALNLTAPRVESASIDDIMSRVRYVVSVVEGTTTTLATAVTDDGFTLAIGQTSCVDPDNFNASVGAKWAIEDAKKKARDELWKLEGWRLKQDLTQGKTKQ